MSQRAAIVLTMSAVWFLLRTALCRAVMPSFVLKSRCAPPLFSTLMTSAQPSSWAASVRGHSARFEERQCQEEIEGKEEETSQKKVNRINKQKYNNIHKPKKQRSILQFLRKTKIIIQMAQKMWVWNQITFHKRKISAGLSNLACDANTAAAIERPFMDT